MKILTMLCVLAGAALLPAGAQAATLSNVGGTLTYTAEPGATNLVGFNQTDADTVEVHRFDAIGDDDPITAFPGCTQADPGDPYVCDGVTRVVADAGDLDDGIDAGGALALETGAVDSTVLTDIPLEAELGSGDDRASGGQGNDSIGGGPGNDEMLLDGLGFATMAGGADEAFGDEGDDSINGGRGNDTVEGGEGDDALAGGPGQDDLVGESGADFLAAGPGEGDTLDGGAGNDTLTGECDQQPCPAPVGADDVRGGPGFDLFRYESYTTDVVFITLDDAPGDGIASEDDNVHSDVEDVVVTGPAPARVTGSASFNSLTTGSGADILDARDGTPDRVSCGDGADVANVDDVDVVNADCETANAVQTNYHNDAPPTVAWSVPASGARLSTTRANTLTATASDDRGVARVDFLDDERTVCSDTSAPYTCDYRPTGDDVGRNTLVAIAVDTSGQTASAVRSVRVPRFTGRLSARTTPRRDTSAPYRFTTTGRLRLPTGVTRAQGCRGTITVQIKAGKKTVSTRRAKLRSNCTYRSRVTFRLRQRLRPRTLRRSVRFGGNSVMAARSASRQTLRVRR